ncbi:MAG TPA: tRNA pseudouridine(38-40) synthase TruA [Jatrophihabitans sp.]|nr:tRNA pseudouridine(38-40) synthase TruA [Jatrophihabitans sp.]
MSDEPASPDGGGGLVRLRLDLGYDGTDFSGWASQPGRRTVQAVLTEALRTVLRLTEVRLVVAGRTDAGVHASGQVAHLDIPAEAWQAQQEKLLRRLAGLLPPDVRVTGVRPVSPDFDARFAALWRRYTYRITDSETGPDPLRRLDTVAWPRPLDAAAMQRAAQALLGLHDFAAFCRRRAGASTIRSLQRLDVQRSAELIEITVQADAFCHSMVRSLVGALAAVGAGLRAERWPAGLLGLDRRADEVTVAPPHGLNLVAVGYPPDSELAARAGQTRAVRQPG